MKRMAKNAFTYDVHDVTKTTGFQVQTVQVLSLLQHTNELLFTSKIRIIRYSDSLRIKYTNETNARHRFDGTHRLNGRSNMVECWSLCFFFFFLILHDINIFNCNRTNKASCHKFSSFVSFMHGTVWIVSLHWPTANLKCIAS